MKKLAFLVLGILSAPVLAQPNVAQIDIKARVVGTTDWLDTINFESADDSPLNLEVAVFYKWPLPGVAFASVTHNVVVNGWNVTTGDTAAFAGSAGLPTDGRVGTFTFGGQTQGFFTTGIDAGRLRLGAASNVNDVAGGGLSVKQRTPVALGSSLDTSNPALVFRFNISIARDRTDMGTVRNLFIDAPLNKVSTTYGVYASASSTTSINYKSSLLPTGGVSITVSWNCPDSISIDQQPISQWISGDTASFEILATGNTLNYQWRRDSVALVDDARVFGSSTDSLSISDVQPGDFGIYDCVVSNDCVSVTSDPATLACETPSITQQPVDQPSYPGHTATFAVLASGSNLNFQWMKNGVVLVDGPRIAGSTLPSLSITNVQPSDAAVYDCFVFNSCSGFTSSPAQLTCSPVITQQPPASITLRGGATLSVGVPVGSVQSFRWRRDGQNLFNMPGLFSGVTTKTLTFISNDPSIPGGFDCVLSNSCGSVTTTATTVFCPSDLNTDGFVTGEDYDDYRVVFIAGDSAADFDGDGFVTGEDFDAYVEAFILGC